VRRAPAPPKPGTELEELTERELELRKLLRRGQIERRDRADARGQRRCRKDAPRAYPEEPWRTRALQAVSCAYESGLVSPSSPGRGTASANTPLATAGVRPPREAARRAFPPFKAGVSAHVSPAPAMNDQRVRQPGGHGRPQPGASGRAWGSTLAAPRPCRSVGKAWVQLRIQTKRRRVVGTAYRCRRRPSRWASFGFSQAGFDAER
jgi:hypothetical protein